MSASGMSSRDSQTDNRGLVLQLHEEQKSDATDNTHPAARKTERMGEIAFDPENDQVLGANKQAIVKIINNGNGKGLRNTQRKIQDIIALLLSPLPRNTRPLNFLENTDLSREYVQKLLASLRRPSGELADPETTTAPLATVMFTLAEDPAVSTAKPMGAAKTMLFDELRTVFAHSQILLTELYRALTPTWDVNLFFAVMVNTGLLLEATRAFPQRVLLWRWESHHPFFRFVQRVAIFNDVRFWPLVAPAPLQPDGRDLFALHIDVRTHPVTDKPRTQVFAQEEFTVTRVSTNERHKVLSLFTLGEKISSGSFSVVYNLDEEPQAPEVETGERAPTTPLVLKVSDVLRKTLVSDELIGAEIAWFCVQHGHMIGANTLLWSFVHELPLKVGEDKPSTRIAVIQDNAGRSFRDFFRGSADGTAPATDAELLRVVIQIFLALAGFHKYTENVHLDMKLDNVLIEPNRANAAAGTHRYLISQQKEGIPSTMPHIPSSMALFGGDVAQKQTQWTDPEREVLLVDVDMYREEGDTLLKANVIDWGGSRPIKWRFKPFTKSMLSLAAFVVETNEPVRLSPPAEGTETELMVTQRTAAFGDALLRGLMVKKINAELDNGGGENLFARYTDFIALFDDIFVAQWQAQFKQQTGVELPVTDEDFADFTEKQAGLGRTDETDALRILQGAFLFTMFANTASVRYFGMDPFCVDYVAFASRLASAHQRNHAAFTPVAAEYMILGECFHRCMLPMFVHTVQITPTGGSPKSKLAKIKERLKLEAFMVRRIWSVEFVLLEAIMTRVHVPFRRETLGNIVTPLDDVYTVNMATDRQQVQASIDKSIDNTLHHALQVEETIESKQDPQMPVKIVTVGCKNARTTAGSRHPEHVPFREHYALRLQMRRNAVRFGMPTSDPEAYDNIAHQAADVSLETHALKNNERR